MRGAADSASGRARCGPTSWLVKVKSFPSNVLFFLNLLSLRLSLQMSEAGQGDNALRRKFRKSVLTFLVDIVIYPSTFTRVQTTL